MAKKQKKLVVGNWKMNPVSLDEGKKIAREVKRAMRKVRKTQVVLCPPFTFISPLIKTSAGSLFLGAQNVHHEEQGSFTGEVSVSQLMDFKISYIIVGHSERRKMGETEEIINRKMRSVVTSGMTAIVCVGESVRDHNGDYLNFIKQQILSSLVDIPKKLLGNVVIAYEPIWAIGSIAAMTPRDLHEMSIFIRKVLKDTFGDMAMSVRILYGGSVDSVNAKELVKDGDVSGLLVGRQSLKSKDFIEIIKLVDSI